MEKKKIDITEKIKSFEDAMQATGRPAVPDFSNVPENLREYFAAQYKAVVITEALNEGWVPNWSNHNQYKYFPWFCHGPEPSAGFAFCGTSCGYSGAGAGVGSRLCFKSSALARYAGQQFADIYNALLLK